MTGTGIARKYAAALFELARRSGVETSVWNDLSALRDALTADGRFLGFLTAPQVPDQEKHDLVRAVLKDVSSRIVRDFVLFLVDRARVLHLPEIIVAYGQMLDDAQGVVEAVITSAVRLSPDEQKRIVERLERITGKTVRDKAEIDPGILGGVVIMIGGEIIDRSVRHDLSRLRDQLRMLKVHEAA